MDRLVAPARVQSVEVLSPNGNVTVKPAKAVSDPTQAEPPAIVIFATKLGDTEGAAKSLKLVLRGRDNHLAAERR